MWLMKHSPALLMDLYELTMAQVYFDRKFLDTAYFEVSVRRLPENWGFFVMAGLNEVESYIRTFKFAREDIDYLRSTAMFSDDFLGYLSKLEPQVQIRCLPEGTVFFPNEPALELSGPLICAQLMESYILNILGFSIIQTTLATRISLAAGGTAVVDFGLRRCQGPVASIRSSRAAQIASFLATSNVLAARETGFTPSGTMAHSFVQVYESEEQAFYDFARTYGQDAILLVDTYDCVAGIKKAAAVAKKIFEEKGVKIKGIRIDSGNLAELSDFARNYFREKDVSFLKIFVSGDLDEFKIDDLLQRGAQIDGFGVGTRFSASLFAPAIEIVYKLSQYGGKGLHKESPGKETVPGRKRIDRIKDKLYAKDIVSKFRPSSGCLLKPFDSVEKMQTIQERLAAELSCLDDSIKRLRNPAKYPVEFA